MKKLLYLLFAITIIGCSSDDEDNSNLTFFEKYDGVVWEEQTSNYTYRVQINNGNTVFTKSYFDEGNGGDCGTDIILNSDIIRVTEDSFTVKDEDNNGNGNTDIVIVTAINNGNDLTIEYSDTGNIEDYFSRTDRTDPCD